MARLNKTPLTLRLRRGTEAQITATSPAPFQREGEMAYATDTGGFYVSDGTQFILLANGLQDLQSVTDEGNTTTNDIEVGGLKASSIVVGTSTVYSNSININNNGTFRIGNKEFLRKSNNDLIIYEYKLRVNESGNVLIGTNTDAGYKLDVNGTLRTVNDAYFATASGNVGIGTSSPTEKLEIHSGASNDVLIKIQGNDGGNVSSGIYSGIGYLGTQGGFALKSARGTSSDLANLPAFASYLTTISQTMLLLGTDSKRRMLFDYQGDISTYLDDDTTVGMFWDASAGNLGIGTSSPLQPLHIATNNNNAAVALRVSNDNVGGRAGISFNLPNNSNEFYSLGIDNDRYFKIANGTSL